MHPDSRSRDLKSKEFSLKVRAVLLASLLVVSMFIEIPVLLIAESAPSTENETVSSITEPSSVVVDEGELITETVSEAETSEASQVETEVSSEALTDSMEQESLTEAVTSSETSSITLTQESEIPVQQATPQPTEEPTTIESTEEQTDFSFDETTGTVTKYLGASTSVVIPDMIQGIAVQRVGASAFYNMQLTDVSIPSTVKVIEDSAFAQNSLISIGLPDGLEKIGAWAFYGNEISDVAIPSTVSTLGVFAFAENPLAQINVSQIAQVVYGSSLGSEEVSSLIYESPTSEQVQFFCFEAAPPQVQGLTATVSGSNVRLSWSAIEDLNGTMTNVGYIIHRKAPGEVDYSNYDLVNGTSYDDTVTLDGSYAYKVYAYREVASGQLMADVGSEVLAQVYLQPAPVQDLKVSTQGQTATLSWSSSQYADGYYIYRRAPGESSMRYYNMTNLTSFADTLTQEDYYFYQVYPYRMQGDQQVMGPGGNYVYTKKQPAPSPVANLNVVGNGLTATLTWNPSATATGYVVYRQTPDEAKMSYLTEVAGTKFIDTSNLPGYHFYRVYPYRMDGAQRVLGTSNSYVYTNLHLPAPAPVQDLKVSTRGETATLSWSASQNADGYLLYRRAPGETAMSYYRIASRTGFVDTLTHDDYYFYQVYPYRLQGDQRIVGLSGNYVYTKKQVLPPPVENLGVVGDGRAATLTWDASATATGYIIYRQAPGETKMKYRGMVTGTYFRDTGDVAGYHFYRVYPYRMEGTQRVLGLSDAYVYANLNLAPASVQNLKVKGDGLNAVLSWAPRADAEGYIIYRKGPGETGFSYRYVINKAGFVDTVTMDGTYAYRVYPYRTVDTQKHVGKSTSTVSALLQTLPETVRNLAVRVARMSAHLTWTGGADTDGYIIYRRAPGENTMSYRTITTNTQFTDPGTLSGYYYYRVYPYRMDQGKRIVGKSDTYVYCDISMAPTSVGKLELNIINQRPTLTWTAAQDADGYLIYCQTEHENRLHLLARVTTLSYTDSSKNSGFSYYRVIPYRMIEGQEVYGPSTDTVNLADGSLGRQLVYLSDRTKLLSTTKVGLNSRDQNDNTASGSLKVHSLGVPTRYQETDAWCGPAACQQLLAAHGVNVSQKQLATDLGTTSYGTDYVEYLPPVLNRYLGWPEEPEANEPGYRMGYAWSTSSSFLKERIMQNTAENKSLIYNINLRTLYPGLSGYHYITGNGWRELNGELYDALYVDPWNMLGAGTMGGEKAINLEILYQSIVNAHSKYVW